ncbi:hypothetical protein [Flectobacillus longus]|uniref:hypothetical protein n=1 Tax=Flectobacillus longus TaxID=2984207 RepID=UPI0024B75102|nr:hypothetical protein [Flectobacillus longus]MDI9881121.1 hypothetical protein [Flectobacillus longus]
MKSKQELEDGYHWWITCIPDKIDRLEELLPKELYSTMDYTISSLDILEKFLLERFTIQDMINESELRDCLACYLGVVYEKNISQARWYVELENEKDAFYGVPILRVPNKLTFEPHSYITTLLDRKKGNLLSTIIERHKKYLDEN